jgi:hypothetical protein
VVELFLGRMPGKHLEMKVPLIVPDMNIPFLSLFVVLVNVKLRYASTTAPGVLQADA